MTNIKANSKRMEILEIKLLDPNISEIDKFELEGERNVRTILNKAYADEDLENNDLDILSTYMYGQFLSNPANYHNDPDYLEKFVYYQKSGANPALYTTEEKETLKKIARKYHDKIFDKKK